MNRIKQKLRSRRGASITFALLLFLVCAMVSSVVIVAASTAAGHMSSQAEMDQRYYAVAGAVKVLREKLEGEDLKGLTVTVNADGTVLPAADNVQLNPILTYASKKLIAPDKVTDAEIPGTYTATQTNEAIAHPVTCTIEPPTVADGLLKFRIRATGGQNAGSNAYSIDLIFASNVQQTSTTGVTKVSWKFSGIEKVSNAVTKTGGSAG